MSEFDEDDDIDRLEDAGEFELQDTGAPKRTARKVIVKRRLTVKQQIAGLESDECDRFVAAGEKANPTKGNANFASMNSTTGALGMGFSSQRSLGATGSLRPRAGLGGGRSLPKITGNTAKPSAISDSKKGQTKNTEF